jgi:hypothetical protein
MWKIYFWIWALTYLCIYPLWLIAEGSLKVYTYATVTLVGVLGVYGFAYKRRIFNPLFWKMALFLVIGWDTFYNFYLADWSTQAEYFDKFGFIIAAMSIVSLAIPIILTVLEYIALYLYGFRSPDIWLEASELRNK